MKGKIMTRRDIFDKLTELFRDVFDDPNITIDENTNSDDIDGWDSLMYIDLIVAIEDEFGLKFRMNEVNKFKNVGEMVSVIMESIRQ